MSSIYEALRSKPAGLWSLDNSLNDLTGNGNTATASGTVNNALSLAKGAVYSSIFNNQVVASFPTTVFQKGNESKAFSLEAWVRTIQKTTGKMPQTYRENLALNPSITADTQQYSGGALTISSSSTWSASGNNSLKQVPTGSSNDSSSPIGGDVGGIRTGLQPGKTYTVSAWCYAPTAFVGTSINSRARKICTFVKAPSTGTNYVVTDSAQAPTGNIPTRVSVTFSIPSDATEAFIRLYNGSNNAADITYWDAVLIEEGSTLGGYFDGSLPGYEWSGTANLSVSRTRTDVSAVNLVGNPNAYGNGTGGTVAGWSHATNTGGGGVAHNPTSVNDPVEGLVANYTIPHTDVVGWSVMQVAQPNAGVIGTGDSITVIIRARSNLVNGSSEKLNFNLRRADGSNLVVSIPTITLTGTFQTYVTTVTATASALNGNELYMSNPNPTTTDINIDFAYVGVFKNYSGTTFFDGSSDGAIWSSAANNSESLLLASIAEQQILGNTGQYDGLVIDGTSISFVTKYTSTGEARAVYDLENVRACHLVGVHTSDKNLLYVDGVLAAETTISDVQQADTFISSDGKLYSGQTLSSKSIMLNCVGIYTYALDAASILSHFNEARDIPNEEEVPAFYSGDRLGLTLDHANVFLDSLWNSATDWNTGIFSNTVVVNDQLTPQFDSGISLAGTWMSVFPLSVASTATIYGVMADWGGYGAVVELSLDGTTWETMVRGGKMTTLTEGLDPTGKQLFIRVSFTGGVADDDSYIDNLRIVGFADGVLSEVVERTVTLTGAAPRYDKLPLQLDDTWGATVNSGGTVVISADTSDELAPIRTVEVWVKPTSSTMPTLSAAGTSYFNGSATGSLRVGEWTLWHVVLSADLAGSLTITGPAQIGQITVYPTALTATNIADIYASYTCSGSEIIPVTDADTLTMIEPAGAANIYAYDWSITGAG